MYKASESRVCASIITRWGSANYLQSIGHGFDSQCHRSVFRMPVWNFARIIKRYKYGRDGQGSYKVYGQKAYLDGGYEPIVKKLKFDQ